MRKNPGFFKKLLGYFLQGLLYTVPTVATGYVIVQSVIFIDGLLPLESPGLGILVLVLLITVLGFLGQTIIGRPIVNYLQSLLDRVPLVKTIYSAIKELLSAFVGKEKRFNQPVMVKMNRDSDIAKLGFITQKDLHILGIPSDKVAVYLPHSYNFSGNLFIVPSQNITPLDASASDVMKFIVSGGVTSIEEKKPKRS